MSFPIGEIEKLSQRSVDFALQVEAMDEEARNSVIDTMDAITLDSQHDDRSGKGNN